MGAMAMLQQQIIVFEQQESGIIPKCGKDDP